jgi:O-antigen biosynthesis protein
MSATTNPPPVFPPVQATAARKPYVWETSLDLVNSPQTVYEAHYNPQFLDAFASAPRTMLDIGCSTGNLGGQIKAAHPGCRVIGIEPHLGAAAIAASKLDQVIAKRVEDIDFAAEGIAPGSIDTLVAADSLEHIYDPWRTMVTLRPYLTPDAQIILSIPNTRHLSMWKHFIDEGRWTYADRGLLDITHIRFFTLKEIEDFLTQTGYRMEKVNFFLDQSLENFYREHCNRAEINVRVGRLSLEKLTQKEFAEICTWQFFVRARLA